MEGILKLKVEVLKYDGTNKDQIIKRLNIDSYEKLYFKKINTYFIIPLEYNTEEDWFILEEEQFKFKRKILIL